MSLSIGISCYGTVGGSGMVACQLGMALAGRGHQVHFICAEVPPRLDLELPGVHLHRVRTHDYPVFPHAPYSLSLCSKMVEVAAGTGLDLLHVHYAVPHATSAWMAREIRPELRIVTTLHGTDITLVGSDPSYLPITRHSIVQSDAVTAPSAALRDDTMSRFGLDPQRTPIEVIPNFVDVDAMRPIHGRGRPALTKLFGNGLGEAPVLVHVSNFRPLKRVDQVVEVFARVRAAHPGRLLLIGDGPERAAVEDKVAALGLCAEVLFLGESDAFAAALSECAVFLLPSETESFGLAALEALASGVVVVASDVGGLPEVVVDGQTGWLTPVGDAASMAAQTLRVLQDPGERARMGAAARADVERRFTMEPVVDRYEAVYQHVLSATRGG